MVITQLIVTVVIQHVSIPFHMSVSYKVPSTEACEEHKGKEGMISAF